MTAKEQSSADEVSADQPLHRDQEQLLRAARAFDHGDYRLTRELAAPLLRSAEDGVRSDAERLMAQLGTPRLTRLLLALTFLLLTLVTVFAYTR